MHCVQDRFHTDTVWMKKRTKQFYYFQFHSQRSPITCNLRADHLSAFFLIKEETRIKALPESRQSFENALAQTSGLVNLVFTYQTGFSSMCICFNWQTNDHNWAGCTKCIAIWPRFESVSEKHAAHAPERSYLILAEVFSNTAKKGKRKKGSAWTGWCIITNIIIKDSGAFPGSFAGGVAPWRICI